MISEQLSVSFNDNERAIAAEDMSEDSDQSINDPISSGNPENNDAVSVIIESNFNLSDESSICLANTNQLINLLFFILKSRFDIILLLL